MVIPRHLADEVAKESVDMELFEDFVLEEVLQGVPIIGLYPPTKPETLARFEVWKNERDG